MLPTDFLETWISALITHTSQALKMSIYGETVKNEYTVLSHLNLMWKKTLQA